MSYGAIDEERRRQPEEFSGDRPSMRAVPAAERLLEARLEGPTRVFTFKDPGLLVILARKHGGVQMTSPMVKFAGFGATEAAARRDFAERFERDYDGAMRAGGESWLRFDDVAEVAPSSGRAPIEQFWESSISRRCLADVERLTSVDDEDAALDVVYDVVDRLLLEGEFGQCDDMLDLVDVDSMTLSVALALCSITSPARHHLARRVRYVQRLRDRLRRTDPDRMERLLAGIE